MKLQNNHQFHLFPLVYRNDIKMSYAERGGAAQLTYKSLTNEILHHTDVIVPFEFKIKFNCGEK